MTIVDDERITHHRRSIRLREYDYSQPGGYFVTVCTAEKRALFGQIIADEMRMKNTGRIVESEWFRMATARPNLVLDAFVIMPNHVHGVIIIQDDCRGTARRAPTDRDHCIVSP